MHQRCAKQSNQWALRLEQVKLKSELLSEFKELNGTQIFGKHVSGVIGTFNEEKLNLFAGDYIMNKMVAQINMLDALFLHKIRSQEMEPWLSPKSGIGARLMPSSVIRLLIQMSCLYVLKRDMYFALVEDRATVFCAHKFQENIAPASLTI